VGRKLSVTSDADRFLDRLDARQYRQVVRRIFALATDATPADSARLEGSNLRRVDQGEYRIIYSFDTDTVFIIIVGKRNDDEVYAKLRSK
jgi:mRNA interferase RelE/StbE